MRAREFASTANAASKEVVGPRAADVPAEPHHRRASRRGRVASCRHPRGEHGGLLIELGRIYLLQRLDIDAGLVGARQELRVRGSEYAPRVGCCLAGQLRWRATNHVARY